MKGGLRSPVNWMAINQDWWWFIREWNQNQSKNYPWKLLNLCFSPVLPVNIPVYPIETPRIDKRILRFLNSIECVFSLASNHTEKQKNVSHFEADDTKQSHSSVQSMASRPDVSHSNILWIQSNTSGQSTDEGERGEPERGAREGPERGAREIHTAKRLLECQNKSTFLSSIQA